MNLYNRKFAILFNAFLGENVVFYHRENIWNVFGCRSDVMLRIPYVYTCSIREKVGRSSAYHFMLDHLPLYLKNGKLCVAENKFFYIALIFIVHNFEYAVYNLEVQWNLSIADMLYSGHIFIIDTIFMNKWQVFN